MRQLPSQPSRVARDSRTAPGNRHVSSPRTLRRVQCLGMTPALRRLVALSLLLTAVFATAPGRADGLFKLERGERALVLARDGAARAAIMVQRDAPAAVRFAAEELKEHLDLMTGADFPIVTTQPKEGVAIVLGDCAAVRAAGIDAARIARDGYAIRTSGSVIAIAGRDDATAKGEALFKVKSPFPRTASRYAMEAALGAATWDFERGTLYGVYRFLEELGVRWFLPGTKGRVIPTQPDLSFRELQLHEEPAFILRKVGRATWQWYMTGAARTKHMLNPEEYEDLEWGGNMLRLWLLRMRHSSEWFAFNHRPTRMELEERYGKQFPEYFAVRESGQRDLKPQAGRTGHLCYTEPGVLEITKRDIDDYYAGKTGKELGLSSHRLALNPLNRGWPANAIYSRSVSLLPHDSFRGCYCPRCLAITRQDLPRPHWHSALVWQFVTKVAKWMETAHPQAFILCLAYSSYSERPEGMSQLPANVVVGMCPAQYARTTNDVDEAAYADLMRMVGEWRAVSQRPMLIWLHHLYRYRKERRLGMPMLLTSLYERMFRDLSKHANMMHIEMDPDSIMLEHLNRYVMLKLLYNPNLSAEALVDDYAERFYGPGGELIGPLLKDMEKRCLAAARTHANSIDMWEKHFDADTIARYRADTDRMLERVRGTPHAEAGRLFSTWFLGAIENGRAQYVHHVKKVADGEGAKISIRALVGEITIDGVLDEEGWERSARLRRFIGNTSGEPTRLNTEVRLLRAPEHLYFAFVCQDPNTPKLSEKKGDAETVEIFLDPEHDHDSFYQILIDLGGRVQDWYFEGGGEPADATWDSGAKVAVKRGTDSWVIEVQLPRDRIKGGLERPAGRPWGANFCRSMKYPPRPEDTFSGWSPLLRGRFAQPDLFGHIFFVK
jgi:hypothetical protein